MVLQYAPAFAELAGKCLDDIQRGSFRKSRPGSKSLSASTATELGFNADDNMEESSHDGRAIPYKIKWEAMQSYTFDIIDGPVLGMNIGNRDVKDKEKSSNKKEDLPSRDTMMNYMERMKRGLDVIKMTFGPEWMYIWILNEYGRALNARMHIDRTLQKHVARVAQKVPVKRQRGHSYNEPSTRLIPLLTWRKNILRNNEDIFGVRSVARKNDDFAANRRRAQSAPDVFQEVDGNYDVMGCDSSSSSSSSSTRNNDDFVASRRRAQSAPEVIQGRDRSDDGKGYDSEPLDTEQNTSENSIDIKKSTPVSSPSSSPKSSSWIDQWITSAVVQEPHKNVSESLRNASLSRNGGESSTEHPRSATTESSSSSRELSNRKPLTDRHRAVTGAEQSPTKPSSCSLKASRSPAPVAPTVPRRKPNSLLERMLRQQSHDGKGVSQVVMTEIAIMLWMILDAGNAWTAMALNLLSADGTACELVQNEIRALEIEFGQDQLFSAAVLEEMKYVDALIYEAIRLCPPFLGGLKVTSETVFLSEDNVQIPKGSNIFFCQPTEQSFNIRQAVGKRPEDLGQMYPTIELYGFLPFQGLEVPLMVLQSKVFLVTLLRRYTPCTSKRKTFIRRVTSAVGQKLMNSPMPMRNKLTIPVGSADDAGNQKVPLSGRIEAHSVPATLPTVVDAEDGRPANKPGNSVTPREAMRWFSKLPFPEPRHVVYLIPRVNEEE